LFRCSYNSKVSSEEINLAENTLGCNRVERGRVNECNGDVTPTITEYAFSEMVTPVTTEYTLPGCIKIRGKNIAPKGGKNVAPLSD
jgi:hypothetical protein